LPDRAHDLCGIAAAQYSRKDGRREAYHKWPATRTFAREMALPGLFGRATPSSAGKDSFTFP